MSAHIPTLTRISTRECPVCETQKVRRVEIRDLHTNGSWNEYLEFNCGYIEHYSPNFHTIEVQAPCRDAMRVATDLRKQLRKEE